MWSDLGMEYYNRISVGNIGIVFINCKKLGKKIEQVLQYGMLLVKSFYLLRDIGYGFKIRTK